MIPSLTVSADAIEEGGLEARHPKQEYEDRDEPVARKQQWLPLRPITGIRKHLSEGSSIRSE